MARQQRANEEEEPGQPDDGDDATDALEGSDTVNAGHNDERRETPAIQEGRMEQKKWWITGPCEPDIQDTLKEREAEILFAQLEEHFQCPLCVPLGFTSSPPTHFCSLSLHASQHAHRCFDTM